MGEPGTNTDRLALTNITLTSGAMQDATKFLESSGFKHEMVSNRYKRGRTIIELTERDLSIENPNGIPTEDYKVLQSVQDILNNPNLKLHTIDNTIVRK